MGPRPLAASAPSARVALVVLRCQGAPEGETSLPAERGACGRARLLRTTDPGVTAPEDEEG
jgi:hypothetical protein